MDKNKDSAEAGRIFRNKCAREYYAANKERVRQIQKAYWRRRALAEAEA